MSKPVEVCHQALGLRIRALREALGLSQDDLAKRVGLKRVSVTNVETGRQRFLLDGVEDYARALGTTPKHLMKGIWWCLLIIAASALLPAAAGAECLPTSAAVFTAHPNAAHASYSGRSHPGQRCWFMDKERNSASPGSTATYPRGGREIGKSKPSLAVAPPFPKARPLMAADFAGALTPQQLIDNAFIAVGWNQ